MVNFEELVVLVAKKDVERDRQSNPSDWRPPDAQIKERVREAVYMFATEELEDLYKRAYESACKDKTED